MSAVVVATDAHEGPVVVGDALYFTSVPGPGPRAFIRRLALGASGEVSTVPADVVMPNGMTLAPDGRRLLVCEQGSRRRRAAILLVDPQDGRTETVVDSFLGLPLNSPNDVVTGSDGSIWFTDPSYGHVQGFRPPPQLPDQVYRHDPGTGATSVAADGFDKPNGLAFSPGEDVLYVGDSEADEVLAFDVASGGRLRRRRRFAAIVPGHPDGIRTDPAGRVYVSFAGGIRVFEPSGAPAGDIPLPGAVHFTFAGDGGQLLVTADDGIHSAVPPVP